MKRKSAGYRIGDSVRHLLTREVGTVVDGWHILGNGWLLTVMVRPGVVYDWWKDCVEGVESHE